MSKDYSKYDENIKILNDLPKDTLDIVSNIIKEFNSKEAKDIDDAYIHDVVNNLAYVYISITYPFNNLDIWRVRPSKCGELFENITELKYPPTNFIIDFGRANTPFSPVFYAASSPETAFAESRLKENDYFHLTRYCLKDKMDMHTIIIGDMDSLRRRKKTIFDIPEYADKYEYIFSSLKDDICLAVQLVDAFFIDRLSRKGNQDEYRITSRIINEFLQFGDTKVSGIIYPSVEHAGGHNYAYKPECYDKFITPTTVQACKVIKEYGYGAYKNIQSIPADIKEDGLVFWSEGIRSGIASI
ncbi:MAG: RES family NAD+ phosphorylase [Sulfurimonas sp.]|jgi:hypothetical protein